MEGSRSRHRSVIAREYRPELDTCARRGGALCLFEGYIMTNWKFLLGGVAAVAIAAPAYAQVTTSNIRGTITTEAGAPVSGATVVVRHEPSGTVSTASTNASGVFSARNLRVGGPFSVTVSGGDFTPVEVTDIFVNIDETFDLDLTVSGARTLETIVVTAPAVTQGYLDTGLGTSLGLEELNEVVSIDRDITDAAQLDPFAAVNIQSGGAKELSIAGANNRYNSLTVDGIKLNDRFGLNANGYPTQRSPISFDAIQSLQIESAPMDTEFNGFTGGTVNAVTKSGENEFFGSAFYFATNDNFAGSRLGDRQVSRDFEEETYGFTLGGPIIKDKLFFFVNYDFFEEAAPLNRGIEGTGALNIENVTAADAAQITQIAQSVYGLETGDFSKSPVEDEKILASIDWNINNDHRAKFTYIKTEGSAIQEQNGNNFVEFSPVAYNSSWYNRSETIESYIGHVFSDWTPNFSTEFKVAFTEQATGQDSLLGAETPLISVRTSTGTRISFGPDRFRHGNELDQEFAQYKAKAEYLWGDHTFKVGFEREEVDVNNLFAQNSEGTYAFDSIADFQNNIPSGLSYDNAITNDENDLRAIWGWNVNSLYAQDTWDIRENLTLLFGLRYDWYETEGSIRQNANFQTRNGFTNTNDIDGLDVIQPRFGFTWEAKDNVTVRGGLGRFSGGSPSVWISNNYSNDGVINESVFFGGDGGVNVFLPTAPDATTGQYLPPAALTALSGQSPNGPVNALDPNFEIPSTWKANIGVQWDVDFPFSEGWTFTGDVLYNKLENAPFWYLASCDPASTAPDGRPVYDCGRPEEIVLGSTDKGESLLWAVSASKEFENGFDLFASYTNQDVTDIGYGTSSTATSNYSDSPRFDLQVPREQTSRYQVEHSFKLRLDWEKEFFGDNLTKVSLFGTRRSGQPYSYTFSENNNCVFDVGGGRCARESRVDDAGHLLYVPSGPSDPLFAASSFGGDATQQQAFFDYINNSELSQYKGGVAEANGDNSRWTTIVDLRLQQELPGVLEGHKTKLFMDIENLGNLINDDWGHITRTRYEYERDVVSARIVNGQYEYFNLQSDSSIKNLETLTNSLWQIQFGVKYEF